MARVTAKQEAYYAGKFAELVDARDDVEMIEACRFVKRAGKLYSRDVLERELAGVAKSLTTYPEEGKAWRACFAQWLAGSPAAMAPRSLVGNPESVVVQLAERLTFAPRIA